MLMAQLVDAREESLRWCSPQRDSAAVGEIICFPERVVICYFTAANEKSVCGVLCKNSLTVACKADFDKELARASMFLRRSVGRLNSQKSYSQSFPQRLRLRLFPPCVSTDFQSATLLPPCRRRSSPSGSRSPRTALYCRQADSASAGGCLLPAGRLGRLQLSQDEAAREESFQMTPLPSISPSVAYQTANWPGVMLRWGRSNRMNRPFDLISRVASSSGCR